MRVIQFWLAFVLGALGTCSLLHAAAPTVISLYPAGLQQGTSTKITLSGSWTAWPIKIDGELVEGLSVNVLEEAGSIEIQAADSVPAGPYYFRIYDAEEPVTSFHLSWTVFQSFRKKSQMQNQENGVRLRCPL